jgi:AcrR family transcriptional regulator
VTKPPNPDRRSERGHRAVLDAALRLCVEQGYARTTVEGIAARAGVSKKTIYRWWPSKWAVVLEAIDEVTATIDHPDTGDIAADLRAQLTALVALFNSPATGPALTGVIAEGLNDPDLARQLRERLVMPRIDAFKERMRRAQQQGQVPAGSDLDVALDMVYGPVYHRLVFSLGLPDPRGVDRIVHHALRALDPA